MATETAKKSKPVPGQVPLTFQAMQQKIKRPFRIVHMVMDTEAAAEIEALEALHKSLLRRDEVSAEPALAPEVAARLADVEDAARESVAPVKLQAISHTAYKALRAKHPPTAEQVDRAKDAGGVAVFDSETFCPALVLAQMVEPAAPGADAWQVFWDDLSDGQLNQLWTAALAAQMQVVRLESRTQTAADVLRELGLS